jgi:hypothetical protein
LLKYSHTIPATEWHVNLMDHVMDHGMSLFLNGFRGGAAFDPRLVDCILPGCSKPQPGNCQVSVTDVLPQAAVMGYVPLSLRDSKERNYVERFGG